jgi:hypothetical protein
MLLTYPISYFKFNISAEVLPILGLDFFWLLGVSMKEVYAAICEQAEMTISSYSFSMIELIYM